MIILACSGHRACEDLVPLSTECVPVTGETIEGAVRWLWALDRCAAIARSSTCEAVLKAIADKHVRRSLSAAEPTSGRVYFLFLLIIIFPQNTLSSKK